MIDLELAEIRADYIKSLDNVVETAGTVFTQAMEAIADVGRELEGE
jgi:hypothetical protein